MEIRKAGEEDLAGINEIYNQAVMTTLLYGPPLSCGMEYRRKWFSVTIRPLPGVCQ